MDTNSSQRAKRTKSETSSKIEYKTLVAAGKLKRLGYQYWRHYGTHAENVQSAGRMSHFYPETPRGKAKSFVLGTCWHYTRESHQRLLRELNIADCLVRRLCYSMRLACGGRDDIMPIGTQDEWVNAVSCAMRAASDDDDDGGDDDSPGRLIISFGPRVVLEARRRGKDEAFAQALHIDAAGMEPTWGAADREAAKAFFDTAGGDATGWSAFRGDEDMGLRVYGVLRDMVRDGGSADHPLATMCTAGDALCTDTWVAVGTTLDRIWKSYDMWVAWPGQHHVKPGEDCKVTRRHLGVQCVCVPSGISWKISTYLPRAPLLILEPTSRDTRQLEEVDGIFGSQTVQIGGEGWQAELWPTAAGMIESKAGGNVRFREGNGRIFRPRYESRLAADFSKRHPIEVPEGSLCDDGFGDRPSIAADVLAGVGVNPWYQGNRDGTGGPERFVLFAGREEPGFLSVISTCIQARVNVKWMSTVDGQEGMVTARRVPVSDSFRPAAVVLPRLSAEEARPGGLLDEVLLWCRRPLSEKQVSPWITMELGRDSWTTLGVLRRVAGQVLRRPGAADEVAGKVAQAVARRKDDDGDVQMAIDVEEADEARRKRNEMVQRELRPVFSFVTNTVGRGTDVSSCGES